MSWGRHHVHVGDIRYESNDEALGDDAPVPAELEAWIGALIQAEHLGLLVGNGLTTAQTILAGGVPPTMSSAVAISDDALRERVELECARIAEATGRGIPNLEDSLRVSLGIADALRVIGDSRAAELQEAVDAALASLRSSVLEAERAILMGADRVPPSEHQELTANGYLVSLLLTFASRNPTRDRLNLFTTNYDRLIEYGCEVAGLRGSADRAPSLGPVDELGCE